MKNLSAITDKEDIVTKEYVDDIVAKAGAVSGVKGNAETTYRAGNVNITPANIGLGNVENKSSATIRGELTKANVTTALGYTPPTSDTNTTYTLTQDSADGHKITLTPSTGTATTITIPDNNTTYSDATTSAHGLMTAADKTKLNGIATGAEVNQNAFAKVTVGTTTIEADTKQDTLTLEAGTNITLTPDATNDKVTIAAKDTTYSSGTGISISGTTINNSGVRSVATGTTNGTISVNTNGTSANVAVKGLGSAAYTASTAYLAASLKGAKSGVAELDANGQVPSSQLPSYVDDVLEYETTAKFPTTGETGKIYVATSTNLTYRWSGSAYVEISPSIALGTTSSTAFRGDYGNTAYGHATDSSRLTTATASGLYKVAATKEGHIASLTAVTKSDITGLGIPASGGVTGVKGSSETSYRTGDVNITAANTGALPISGGTMTGVLTMRDGMYEDGYNGALNMNNSDIYGLNSIYTQDKSDGAAEGIHFWRDATHVDTLWMADGALNFVPNRAIGTNTTAANSQRVGRFTATPTTNQVVVTDGTTGGMKSSGFTIGASVPSDAKFTDTTYSSLAAANGGTAVSLVTTGEKYSWNNKSNLAIGTTATTAAAGNHTHTTSIATSTGTSQLTLAASTKYALTAGGTSYVFTTPPNTTYSAMSQSEATTGTATTGRLITAKVLNDTIAAKAGGYPVDEYLSGSATFNADGSITEVIGAYTQTTTFNADGSITETLKSGTTTVKTRKTTFGSDGKITITVS